MLLHWGNSGSEGTNAGGNTTVEKNYGNDNKVNTGTSKILALTYLKNSFVFLLCITLFLVGSEIQADGLESEWSKFKKSMDEPAFDNENDLKDWKLNIDVMVIIFAIYIFYLWK